MAIDGYFGTRVPSIRGLSWTSTVPTGRKNIDEYNKQKFNVMLIWGPLLGGGVGYALGGWVGAGIGAFFMLYGAGAMAEKERERPQQLTQRDQIYLNQDLTWMQEREAVIEQKDGTYYLVLVSSQRSGPPNVVAVPWDNFNVFEVGTFNQFWGDAADRDDVTDTKVIVLTTHDGNTHQVTRTTGGEAGIRKLFAALTSRFGAAARATFMLSLEAAQQEPAGRTSSPPVASGAGNEKDELPRLD
jgi:hypothetical protein